MASDRRLSAHFLRSEFDCRDGTLANPSSLLISRLEVLRGICGGRPLNIVSGYRSPGWNVKVGGAVHSQHLKNRAADLEKGYATLDQAKRAGFTGIGLRAGWVVHVDVRAASRVVWTY